VLEIITTWAEDQLPTVYPNPSFPPTVYCFISSEQLTRLAKDAHVIMNLDDLQKALGQWRFFQSYGTELLVKLRAAHFAAEEVGKASGHSQSTSLAQAASRTEQLSSHTERDITWAPALTVASMKQLPARGRRREGGESGA
jgi:hypothetical protein